MLMCSVPFILCGSLSHVDDHHEDPWAPASPRKSKRKDSKNPYSSRGLDKFAMVLAELEAKRAKIIAQMGSQDEAWVRFIHSNSNDWVPIVVKLKDHPKVKKVELHRSAEVPVAKGGELPERKEAEKVIKKSFSWKDNKKGLLRWRPRFYWPMVFVVILLCLVMFGRSFAIMCTSIWWYMVPTLKGDQSRNMKKPMKDYNRRMSGKKLVGDHHHLNRSSQPKKMGTL